MLGIYGDLPVFSEGAFPRRPRTKNLERSRELGQHRKNPSEQALFWESRAKTSVADEVEMSGVFSTAATDVLAVDPSCVLSAAKAASGGSCPAAVYDV